MASFQGAFEKPQFTYDDVDVSLIPPRKRDYTSKSKGVKVMTEQSVKDTPQHEVQSKPKQKL